MRVVINEAQINRNRQISHILFFVSLAGMGIGFFFTWTANPATQSSQISCFVLPLLLLMTLTSVRMANTWIREPRPVKVLAEALKGLGQRYTIFHHMLPAAHVLIGPEGVFTITTIWQERAYQIRDQKWSGDEGLMRKLNGFFRQDLIGNPFRDALLESQQMQKLVDKIAPDSAIEVQPVVVFINPKASFEAEEPFLPVLYADPRKKPSLRNFLKDQAAEKRATFSEQDMDKLDAMYNLVTRQEIAEMLGDTVDYQDQDGDISSDADLIDDSFADTVVSQSGSGTVFVVRSGQLYYIGALSDSTLDETLAQLQAETGGEIELIHAYETPNHIAARDRLHKKFDRKRQKDQWFGLSKKDIAWLKSRSEGTN